MNPSGKPVSVPPETMAHEAVTVARVLYLLDRALGQAGSTAVASELVQCADRLQSLSGKPEQLDALIAALLDGTRLAEQTAKQLKREAGASPLQRVSRRFAHKQRPTDTLTLAVSLLDRLHEQKKVLESFSHSHQ